MESRLIFAVINASESKIEWKFHGESEWIYLGFEVEFNSESIREKLITEFGDESISVKLGRNNSFESSISELLNILEVYIRKGKVILSDKDFTKFVEFKEIGLIRNGKIKR